MRVSKRALAHTHTHTHKVARTSSVRQRQIAGHAETTSQLGKCVMMTTIITKNIYKNTHDKIIRYRTRTVVLVARAVIDLRPLAFLAAIERANASAIAPFDPAPTSHVTFAPIAPLGVDAIN